MTGDDKLVGRMNRACARDASNRHRLREASDAAAIKSRPQVEHTNLSPLEKSALAPASPASRCDCRQSAPSRRHHR